MAHTDSLVEITDYIHSKMQTNAASLGLVDVFRNDQELIPQTPAVCVEGLLKQRRVPEGTTSHRTFNVFSVLLMAYHSRIDVTSEVTQRDVEVLAEAIESLLHEDVTLGGLVIHGTTTQLEPGRARRNGILMRSARMVWQGQTLTRL